MTILSRYPWLLLLLLASNYLLAQPIIKEKSSLIYTITPTDSIVRAQKVSTYASDGTLLTTKNYYYSLSAPGVLTKEETANYIPSVKILTEGITRYPKGKEPESERLETRYLVYAPQEKDSKRIWRRHFDKYGELTKEDTLTYNERQQLINTCQYNYMGSTSLLCDEYQYKDSLRTRWITNSKWNTINGKSEVVEKQTERRDYRYCYNRRGQLKRVRAKDYSNKIRRKLCYDKEGRLEEDHLIAKRKIKRAVLDSEGKKTDKTRNRLQKTENILLYEKGQLVSLQRLIDGQEIKQELYVYQDSLLQKEKIIVGGKPTEEILYRYKEGLLTEKAQHKYDAKGNLRYTIKNYYNANAQMVRKEQISRNTVLSITEWRYNEQGHILEESSYRPKPKNAKKGVKTFGQTKEKIVYIYTYH